MIDSPHSIVFDEAETLDLQYLQAMYVALSVMTLLISALRRGLEIAAEKLAGLAGKARPLKLSLSTAIASDLGYLDSS